MLNRIADLATDPVFFFYQLRAKLDPQGLWRRYAALSQAAGLKKLYLVMSFDCDTVEDIAVVGEVHSRLLDLGVKPVYAVPGELLQKGDKVYSRIFAAGGEFINHGYAEHTYFNTERKIYSSCFFYDQISRQQVREDIIRGDACLREILGLASQGFRCPHFGTFQKQDQLYFLHAVLRDLNYKFSASTTPYFAFRYGAVFDHFGVWEIPLSGMGNRPFWLLDSWGTFAAPDRILSPETYNIEGAAAAKIYQEIGVGILNYYADPWHIHNQEIFFETVRLWQSVAQSVSYGELFGTLL